MSTILGLRFFVETIEEAVSTSLRGGLVIAPSGPCLAKDLVFSPAYRRAALEADVVLTDSSAMVAIYRIVTRQRVPRHSGLKFLRELIDRTSDDLKSSSLWIMSTERSKDALRDWLTLRSLELDAERVYVAPTYKAGAPTDQELLRQIEASKPKIVVINIGGGTQEILGHWLLQNLSYKPTIVCTGAAIEFLTGIQVRIPPVIDRCGMGWFWRCMSRPRTFVPRYWAARHLVPLIIRYREKLPPLRGGTVPA